MTECTRSQWTEERFVREVRRLWPGEGCEASSVLVDLVADGVARHPNSSPLWRLLGEVIQLACADCHYDLSDAKRALERSLECDPENADAIAELAWFYEAVLDDPAAALPLFRRAIDLGAPLATRLGLARTLAETGNPQEATRVAAPLCDVAELRDAARVLLQEIESGLWSP